MTGAVAAALASIGAKGPVSYAGVAGSLSGATGFSNGGGIDTNSYGSLSPAADPNGFVIDQLAQVSTTAIYVIEGNHTGAMFTSIKVGANTLLRSAAATPAGVYNAGTDATKWTWTGSFPFTNGVAFTATITP